MKNVKVKEKLGVVSIVGVAMLPAVVQAAEITAISEGAMGEIDAGKAVIISLFSAAAILLGIFAGYRYFKRGANSA